MRDGALDVLRHVVGRDHEVGEGDGDVRAVGALLAAETLAVLLRHLQAERGQLKELDVALLDGLLFQHFARDALEADVDVALLGHLAGDLVELEAELPAEDFDGVGGGGAGAGLPDLADDVLHVAQRNGRVYAADMHEAAVAHAVEPGVAVERLCAVEVQHEAAVGELGGGGLTLVAVGELGGLPGLALVLAQVLHDERANALDAEQALARGVDGEAAEVGGDPAAAELLGDGGRRAAAAEAVEDEVALVGGGVDDAFEEGFGFLCRVANSLISRCLRDICPTVRDSSPL